MQIAYNSNGWRLFPITTAIEQLAQLGYSAIELSCQPDQLFPLHFLREDARVIRDAAEQAGIMISSLHAGDRNLLGANGEPSFISPDAEGRARRIRASEEAIDLCAELGAEITVVTSGALDNKMTISDSWRYLEDGIGDCIDHARRTGVLLLIEPEPELFIRSTVDFLTLFRRLDCPAYLGLNLDIGHSHCLFEDTAAVIREIKELLMHVHLEDISNRQHKHLMPGEGEIGFSPIRDALQEIGYSGCVSVELYDHSADPWQAARQAREFLSSWAAATVSAGQRG